MTKEPRFTPKEVLALFRIRNGAWLDDSPDLITIQSLAETQPLYVQIGLLVPFGTDKHTPWGELTEAGKCAMRRAIGRLLRDARKQSELSVMAGGAWSAREVLREAVLILEVHEAGKKVSLDRCGFLLGVATGFMGIEWVDLAKSALIAIERRELPTALTAIRNLVSKLDAVVARAACPVV